MSEELEDKKMTWQEKIAAVTQIVGILEAQKGGWFEKATVLEIAAKLAIPDKNLTLGLG